MSSIKDQDSLFIADIWYLSAFYYGQNKGSKYLYLTSSYMRYSEKMKVWRNIIPEVQKNPRCPKFFFTEDLLQLDYLHYILISRQMRESVEIEFPEVKNKYLTDYESEDFILYRKNKLDIYRNSHFYL